MIDFQNITLGSLQVQEVTLGSIVLWSQGGGGGGDTGITMSITPTALSLASGSSNNTIQVTSSDSTWTCSSNAAWITVTKTSTTTARVSVTANSASTSSRSGQVVFKVNDIIYATLSVTQQGALNQPFPTGWNIITEDGDWALAYREQSNYYTFAIIYRYETAPPSVYTANWDFDFNWEDEGEIQYDNLNGGQDIDGDTFHYGTHTYYGLELDEVPNLDVSTISVNYFEAYAV